MTFRATILVGLMIALYGTPVAAQVLCGLRGKMVEAVTEKYGETLRGMGLVGSRSIFEIYASEITGTWTILKTTPNGITCMLAAGEAWQDIDPPLLGESL